MEESYQHFIMAVRFSLKNYWRQASSQKLCFLPLMSCLLNLFQHISRDFYAIFPIVCLTEPLSTYYKRSLCSFSNCMFAWTSFNILKEILMQFFQLYVWLNLFQHITRDLYAVFPVVCLPEPLSAYYKRSLCSFYNCMSLSHIKRP
jgi:hypothetical protein